VGLEGGGNTTGNEGEDAGNWDAPLRRFHEHSVAVKALGIHVLATGGETQNKHIRFWNVLKWK
jgi:cell division cycle 20-like protein 1 (cofactor of APC complex)